MASGTGSFSGGGRGATGGTQGPGLAASRRGPSSTIFTNLGLLAGTGGGSGVGGPRGDRWKDLSLSQFREAATAVLVGLTPCTGILGSRLGLLFSGKQGAFRRLGPGGRTFSGGSLILRETAGTLGLGSTRRRASGSRLESSGAGPESGRPRLGGGGGSKGPGPLEVKEWARGTSEKTGFLGVGTGGGG